MGEAKRKSEAGAQPFVAHGVDDVILHLIDVAANESLPEHERIRAKLQRFILPAVADAVQQIAKSHGIEATLAVLGRAMGASYASAFLPQVLEHGASLPTAIHILALGVLDVGRSAFRLVDAVEQMRGIPIGSTKATFK